jgi:branched-chain amino acid transport system permease protein
MLYREAGHFKTSYRTDQAIFPIVQDKIFVVLIIVAAFVIPPVFADEYWLQAILLPVLVFSMAALGLNLLTGYCGQISLGTGGFMAVGGYMAYKFTTWFPDMNLLVVFVLAGVCAALVGIVFGLPSLRIKGFYLAVATLAAQFFLQWLFNKVPFFYNYQSSGTVTAPPRTFIDNPFDPSTQIGAVLEKYLIISGPTATAQSRYLFSLLLVVILALAAKNMMRLSTGRSWMAIRDMDIAAEIIGIRPLRTKLTAFAISSFYCGVAGAMLLFLWLGSIETEAYGINISFNVLFMIIIGGLGSILGSFLGAAFIVLLPVLLTNLPHMFGVSMAIDLQKHLEFMIFGGLIIFFLIVEPLGLARLWHVAKEKLRTWPFPY